MKALSMRLVGTGLPTPPAVTEMKATELADRFQAQEARLIAAREGARQNQGLASQLTSRVSNLAQIFGKSSSEPILPTLPAFVPGDEQSLRTQALELLRRALISDDRTELGRDVRFFALEHQLSVDPDLYERGAPRVQKERARIQSLLRERQTQLDRASMLGFARQGDKLRASGEKLLQRAQREVEKANLRLAPLGVELRLAGSSLSTRARLDGLAEEALVEIQAHRGKKPPPPFVKAETNEDVRRNVQTALQHPAAHGLLVLHEGSGSHGTIELSEPDGKQAGRMTYSVRSNVLDITKYEIAVGWRGHHLSTSLLAAALHEHPAIERIVADLADSNLAAFESAGGGSLKGAEENSRAVTETPLAHSMAHFGFGDVRFAEFIHYEKPGPLPRARLFKTVH